MANNTTYSSRFKHKRDTAANWEKVKDTFQPFEGELIVVDTAAGATRFKVGRYDSSKSRLLYYGELPFTDEYLYSATNEKLGQISEIIDGKAPKSHTHTKTDVGLGNVDNTADTDKSVKYATSAGSADSITGVVDIAHGGTGGSDRVSAITALLAGGGTETDANIVAPGVYVLNTGTGKNLPSEEGYYIVYVMRYHTDDLACGQLALNLGSNTLYYRAYVTGVWRDWFHPFTNNDTIPIANGGTGATTAAEALSALGGISEKSDGIELGQNLSSSSGFGGYIDFHFNGSTADYTSRLIEADNGVIRDNGSFVTTGYLQSFGGFWVSGRGFFVNSDVHGTSLPAAGTAGRVFFKKV